MLAAAEAFAGMKQRWVKVANNRGPAYVGRVSENVDLQTRKVESLLLKVLSPDDYYRDAIDFGCGHGRFIPVLSHYCGHIWAIDLLDSMLAQAQLAAPNVTPVSSAWPISFAIPPADFLWAGLVLQHIVDEAVYQTTVSELRRVLKPGARVLVLDNAIDVAHHVKPRGPELLARHLELRPGWKADKVTINRRPNDHWFLDGYKA